MQWQDILVDKSLHDLPYRIDLNEKISPASFIRKQ